jgi:hypothetical protein
MHDLSMVHLELHRARKLLMQQSADPSVSPLHRSGKHDAEHEDTGGDSKRFHSETGGISIPHGDVMPQTPRSEAGHEMVDVTSLDRMMSPNKVAKHGDGPGGVKLLGQMLKIEHLDIELDVTLEDQDFHTILQHELNLEEDPYEHISELSAHMKEPSYPNSPQEPAFSAEELQRLDSIADQVEIECLSGLQVLL